MKNSRKIFDQIFWYNAIVPNAYPIIDFENAITPNRSTCVIKSWKNPKINPDIVVSNLP